VHVSRFPTVAALHPEIDLTFRQFIALVSEEPPREFGKSFAFRWLQSPNGPDHTMWLLYFYDHLEFFCSTHSLASVASTTLDQELAKVGALDEGAGSLPTPTASKPDSDPR
jgi:hypothetical protein